jgi:hypothetical protein
MASKFKIGTKGMPHPARSALFRSVIAHMTNNPYFSEPWKFDTFSILICLALADRYDASIISANRGDRDNIATRNEIAEEVQKMLEKIAHYVEIEAGDNLAALRSSGLGLRRQRTKKASSHPVALWPAAPAVGVEDATDRHGAVRIHFPESPGVISTEMQFTSGNPSVEGDWAPKGLLPPGGTAEVDGLHPGLGFFRFRELRHEGLGAWTNPISTFIT